MRFAVHVAYLAGGVELPYVERGSPTGAPVVLLHRATSWKSSPRRVRSSRPGSGSRRSTDSSRRHRRPAERFAAPMLVIWGDRDELIPLEDQERLVAAVPESRLVVYEGAGHVVHLEQPERVARDITAFAASLPP